MLSPHNNSYNDSVGLIGNSCYPNCENAGIPITQLDVTFRAVAYAFTILTGIIGNTIVLVIFYRNPSVRVPVNFHLINIAVVDIITCIFRQGFCILGILTNSWPYGQQLCDFNGYMQTLCYLLTLASLLAIAISRYLVIVYQKRVNSRWTRIIIIIIWIYALVHCMWPIFKWNRYSYHKFEFACLPDYKFEMSYPLYCAIADFLLPVIIITYCYAKIYLTARIRHVSFSLMKGQRQVKSRQDIKLTRNMFFVYVAFIVCYLPYSVSMLIVLPTGTLLPGWYIWLSGWLVNFNSSVNPILYNFIFRRFRKIYRAILHDCDWSMSSETKVNFS